MDDGSRDETVPRLLELRAAWPELRVVKLRRNVGHQSALAAGLRAARGDYVVSIDADLQDPPEVIPDLIAGWREGYHVVYAQRADREGETWLKRATAPDRRPGASGTGSTGLAANKAPTSARAPR